MKITAMIALIWVALAATAGAQGAPSKPPGSGASSKASEVRSLVHELQGHTGKLADLNEQYRSHIEQRPQGNDAQLAKWDAALERLLGRIDAAHKVVVDSKQRLEQAIAGQTLSTSLGKDVANARNEADAERAAAEQALAKSKPGKGKAAKQAKPKPAEKAPPPLPDDLDL
jgi:hypothetical protein